MPMFRASVVAELPRIFCGQAFHAVLWQCGSMRMESWFEDVSWRQSTSVTSKNHWKFLLVSGI